MKTFRPLPYIPEDPNPKFPPGFVIVPKEVLGEIPTIRASGLAVYVILAKHARNETGKSFPGLRMIATETGLDGRGLAVAPVFGRGVAISWDCGGVDWNRGRRMPLLGTMSKPWSGWRERE